MIVPYRKLPIPRALPEAQERPDDPADLAKLPRLELSDLQTEITTIPLEETDVAGVKTLHHDLFTNGIAYFDIGFDLSVLPQEYLPYVPLLAARSWRWELRMRALFSCSSGLARKRAACGRSRC